MSSQRDLGLSLVLHAVLVTAWALVALQRTAQIGSLNSEQAQPPIWIEVDSFRPQSRVRQQIVRSDTGERTEDAAPDAFLGEKTRTVTRQQIKLGNSASRASAASGSESKRAAKVQLKDLALGDFSRLSRLAEREKTSTTENALSGESGEYVKGLKEGESTALNTREFVFYSFFERIRAQLDQAWEPILRAELIRHYQSGRRLASDQDHITQLVVYLARSGQVVKVEVLSESGTRLLDEAAIRAFNRAGPFPNPPQGLIGNGQSIRIQWQFILKT